MRLHELKCWPEFFRAMEAGRKPFEFRRDDRGFEEGDRLMLVEYDPSTGMASGRFLMANVDLIIRECPGLPAGYVIMSLKDIS
jgi:hypothetical protein